MRYTLCAIIVLFFFSACSEKEAIEQVPDTNRALLKTLKEQEDGSYTGSVYQSETYKKAKAIDAGAQTQLDELSNIPGITLKGATRDIDKIALSGNGRFAVTGGPNSELIFFDLEHQKVLHKQKLANQIEALAISKDGRFALSAIWGSGDVLYWDVLQHTVINTVKVDKENVSFIMFAPGEKSFYSISGRMNLVKHHDLKSGSLLKVHNGIYHNRLISKDAKYTIADANKLWNLHTGQLEQRLEWHDENLDTYALSNNGKTALATTRKGQIIYWDLESGKIISYINAAAHRMHDIVYTKDDTHAIAADYNGNILFIDLAHAVLVKTLPFSEDARFDACVLALSSDESFLLAGGNDYHARVYLQKYEIEAITSLWNKAKKQKRALYAATQANVRLPSLVYFKDGIYLSQKESLPGMEKLGAIAIGTLGEEVDFEQEVRPEDDVLAGKAIKVSMPLLSPDEKFALVGSENALLYYDARTGEIIHRFTDGVVGDIFAYAISHDGAFALFADANGKIYHADLADGEITAVYQDHRYGVQSLEFSSDDRFFISASMDRNIKIRELESGKVIQTLQGHTGNIRHAYLSKDGQRAVSFSWYGKIHSWNVTSGQGVVIDGHMKDKNLVRIDMEEGSVVGYFDENLELHPYENASMQRYLLEYYDAIGDVSVDASRTNALVRNVDLHYVNLRTGEIIATFKNRSASHISRDGKNGVTLNQDFSIETFNIGLEMLRNYQ